MKKALLLLALLLVIALPFIFRNAEEVIHVDADDTVVILTGHAENIRFETRQAFQKWYKERTGRTVYADIRYIGGISEIVRYINSTYANAFKYYWTHDLGREWTQKEETLWINRTADRKKWNTPEKKEFYEKFYNSDVSCGVDLFWGGGALEFQSQADLGTIVDTGFLKEHPELFNDNVIPHCFAGEENWDEEGRWFGQVFSSMGIIYNADVLNSLGLKEEQLQQWQDLTHPALFQKISLADPAKSSAILKAMTLIPQQQILFRLRELKQEHPNKKPELLEKEAIEEGWIRGLQVLQIISANTRYYAAAPSKMLHDIAEGNSVAGISVDMMAHTQAYVENQRSGHERVRFVLPKEGSGINADPIAFLRGAPNLEVAKLLVEFLLSKEGQQIYTQYPKTPGGPTKNALFRPAINKQIYADESLLPYRTSHENIYVELANEDLNQESIRLPQYVFKSLRWIIKLLFIEPHDELVSAWGAILKARAEGRTEAADRAYAILSDFTGFSYDEIKNTLAPIMNSGDVESSLVCQRKIIQRFRQQYQRAEKVANGTIDR